MVRTPHIIHVCVRNAENYSCRKQTDACGEAHPFKTHLLTYNWHTAVRLHAVTQTSETSQVTKHDWSAKAVAFMLRTL